MPPETAINTMLKEVARHLPRAQIDGVLVQPMVTGLEKRLLGFDGTILVGPVVTVGAGGVMAEIYHDHPAGSDQRANCTADA